MTVTSFLQFDTEYCRCMYRVYMCVLTASQCSGRCCLFPQVITAARCQPCRDACSRLQDLHEEM